MRRPTVAAAALAVLVLAAPALAQSGPPPGDRPRQRQILDPERAWAAWELQAEGVAARLGLDEETTSKLVKAYVKSRSDHRKALRTLRQEMRGGPDDLDGDADRPRRRRGAGAGTGTGAGAGADPALAGDGGAGGGDTDAERPPRRGAGVGAGKGDAAIDEDQVGRRAGRRQRGINGRFGGAMREAMDELRETERAKLKSSMVAFLPAAQAESALPALGAFDTRWDRMVDTLAGFELGDEKLFAALEPVEASVTAFAKARLIMEDGDWETAREAMMASREELHDALDDILTEDQISTLNRQMRRPGGRGGGGRPGGGRARGGSGADAF